MHKQEYQRFALVQIIRTEATGVGCKHRPHLSSVVLGSLSFDICRKKLMCVLYQPEVCLCVTAVLACVGCCIFLIVRCVEKLGSNFHAVVSSYPSPGLALTLLSFWKQISSIGILKKSWLTGHRPCAKKKTKKKVKHFENTMCIWCLFHFLWFLFCVGFLSFSVSWQGR